MSAGALLPRRCRPASGCRPRPSGGQRLRRASTSPWRPIRLAGILGQVVCCGQQPKPEYGQLLSAVAGHPLCAAARPARPVHTGHSRALGTSNAWVSGPWWAQSSAARADRLGIHDDAWLAERIAENHVSGLAADARQTDKLFQRVRNFPAEAIAQTLTKADERLRLGAESIEEIGPTPQARSSPGGPTAKPSRGPPCCLVPTEPRRRIPSGQFLHHVGGVLVPP